MRSAPLVGPVIVGLSGYIVKIYLDLRKTEKARIEDTKAFSARVSAIESSRVRDAQAVTNKLLEMATETREAAVEQVKANTAVESVLNDVRGTLRDFINRCRSCD